jgi:hypothetical protein
MFSAMVQTDRPFRATLRRLALVLGMGAGCLFGALVAPATSYAFPPVNTSPPTTTGTAQQGQTLTEMHGSWINLPILSYAYQWQRCNSSGESCSSVSGATSQTYVPTAEDVGHELRVQEIASNFNGPGSPATSPATSVIVPPIPEETALPTITGVTQQGQALTEAHGSWTNAPTGYVLQWQRCNSSGESCASISGATSQTYVPTAEDVGHDLRAQETASNSGGSSSPAVSRPTAVVAPSQLSTSLFTTVTPKPGDPPPARPTSVVISIRSVTVNRQGVATIPLSCPAGSTEGCRGKVTITIHIAEHHARRARAARCARGCRPLGTTNYEARAGQKVGVRVHIASFGRRLLKSHSSVRVTLTATSVAGGQTATVTRAIGMKKART